MNNLCFCPLKTFSNISICKISGFSWTRSYISKWIPEMWKSLPYKMAILWDKYIEYFMKNPKCIEKMINFLEIAWRCWLLRWRWSWRFDRRWWFWMSVVVSHIDTRNEFYITHKIWIRYTVFATKILNAHWQKVLWPTNAISRSSPMIAYLSRSLMNSSGQTSSWDKYNWNW